MSERIKETKDLDLSSFEKNEVIKASLQTCVEGNLPIAIWKLPHQNEINLIISFDSAISLDRLDIQELPKGFVFSPFDLQKSSSLFIKSDLHLSFNFDEVIKNPTDTDHPTQSEFLAQLGDNLEKNTALPSYHFKKEVDLQSSKDYLSFVANGIEAIQNNQFEKVVPARTKTIVLDDNFDLIEKFNQLCSAYSNAFVSLVSIPDVGTWLGATPELLLEVNRSIFRTVALAGTQAKDPSKHISEPAWTQKEIEEQALVSRYVVSCFKKIRLRDYHERGPRTTVAGNLLHLKTEFEVDMKNTNFPELGTVMLELLHPTSAVAGMPKEAAMDFIQKNEGFDREFYSGFLGPIQNEQQTHIFVNLRCMQLLKSSAILYAGAGVTEDSIPEKELQETEMKFNTLLNILNPQN